MLAPCVGLQCEAQRGVGNDYILQEPFVFLRTKPTGFIEKERSTNYVGLVKSRAINGDRMINRATFERVNYSIIAPNPERNGKDMEAVTTQQFRFA